MVGGVLIVFTLVAIVLQTVLICSRLHKIKHLGAMMKVSSHVIKKNMPIMPCVMVVLLCLMNLAVWIAMSSVVWLNITIHYEVAEPPIPTWLSYLLCSVFWLWVHGLQISLSDYICQSWVIHWYYQSIL